MYLYDTRNDKDFISRFPLNGWFFPCIECARITSIKSPLFYNKKVIYIPFCKYCKYFNLSITYNSISPNKIKYITNYEIV